MAFSAFVAGGTTEDADGVAVDVVEYVVAAADTVCCESCVR